MRRHVDTRIRLFSSKCAADSIVEVVEFIFVERKGAFVPEGGKRLQSKRTRDQNIQFHQFSAVRPKKEGSKEKSVT